MFVPPSFEVQDQNILCKLIHDYPLATMITSQSTGLEADLIPFLCEIDQEQRMTLKAHIARKNPMYTTLQQDAEVLLVFQAENTYISANYYASKQQGHRVVPTWNYRVVQVKGRIKLIEDEKWLRGLLARLTRKHEQNQPQAWKMTDAPADYIQQNLTQIVGIEVMIEDVQGKFKLNQNKSVEDQLQVAQHLKQQGEFQMAELIFNHAQQKTDRSD